MKDVIIIGTNYSSTLGLARSLGEAGYGVRLLALTKAAYWIAGASKYVTKARRVQIDFFERESSAEELRALEELRGDDEKMLIIPCRDISCMTLEKNWDALAPHFYFPNISNTPGALNRFSNKEVQEALAAECGIPTPRGKAYTTDAQGIQAAVEQTDYPCFMKPLSSSWSKAEKNYLAVCQNGEELRAWMEKAGKDGECDQVIVEDYLPVDEELSAYGMAASGKVYLPACIRTIRSGLGTHKGVAAEGKAVSSTMLGDLKGKLEEFVQKSGLTGLFCIDLLRSGEKIYFLEMNLRIGGSGYAATRAGANLPGALAGMIYNDRQEGPTDISQEVVFLSELIESENYIKGLISRQVYQEHLSGDKVRFIQSSEDPGPWRAYRLFLLRKLMVQKAKKILGRPE